MRDEAGGDILSATPLLRGTDYLLDFFRNTLTFATPVRQIDLDGSGSQGRETEGFRAWAEMENGTERDFLVEEAGDDAADSDEPLATADA